MRCHHANFILAFALSSLLALQTVDAQTTFEFGGLSQADIEHIGRDDTPKEQHPGQVKLYVREESQEEGETAEEKAFREEFPELFVTDGVIITFGAEWCRFCPAQKRRLTARSGHYNILAYDVDEKRGKALANRWGVKPLPTTVICHKGKVVKTFIGLTAWDAIKPHAGKARKDEKQETVIQVFPFIRIDIRDGSRDEPDRVRRRVLK